MRHASLFPVLLLVGLAGPVHAQIRLHGTVVEEGTGAPVAGASVEVISRRGQRVARHIADVQGAFRADLKEQGAYRLRISRMGYQRTLTPLLWTDGHDRIAVEVRLDPEAVLLAPLEIVARSRASPVLTAFHDRIRSGLGHFITRAEIERRQPSQVTDLLATVPGVRLESSGSGFQRTVYLGRVQGRDCPARIFVDGFLVNRRTLRGHDPGFVLDEAVSPGSVEGIEVYRGSSSIPAEFLTPEAECGVVAVWTRRGG